MSGSIEIAPVEIWLGEGLEIKYDPKYGTVDLVDGDNQVNIWLGTETEHVDHLIEVLKEAREDIK